MEQMNISASNHHVGSTERAFVAHVNDLNDFYLHSESVHDSLIKLGQDLYQEYSESYTKSPGINAILNVGDYCACPSESEDWYRGLIRQLDANGHARVFKIDYGDVQCIPIQFLRPLQRRFFDLKRLAFHCSLANLIRPVHGWPVEIIEEFRSRVTTTFLYARFINYNEIRDISEVEITEKSSKTPLNKDFEHHQIPRSTSQMNDKLVYKYIPMETFDVTQANQIRLLYYITPNRFYVYLREKTNAHISFQMDIQKAMQNLHPISSPRRYQSVAAQDNHAVWHRAIILDINHDPSKIYVYFLDIGQRELISLTNIRPLPEEFQCKPAFAIPCSLSSVCPLSGDEQSTWKSNDPVHDEFNRLMVNNVTCQVRAKYDQLYYDVDIDIPKIGDLGTFLFEKNLVSRPIMRSSQPRQPLHPGPHSFAQAQLYASAVSPGRPPQSRFSQPNDYQQTTRMTNPGLTTSTRLPSSANASASNNTSSVVPPQDGYYNITQVRSATEFYGLSQNRQGEYNSLCQRLADFYNNVPNDFSLTLNLYPEGLHCVILHGTVYSRAIIKRRDSETRVSVKLIDHAKFTKYDFNFKKLILDQTVLISQHEPAINGFYPVEVTMQNQSVNRMLLSNDKTPSVTSPTSNNRPNFNHPPPTHIESQVFSNSTRYHPNTGHDSNGRFDRSQRTNETLPSVTKILTGPTRTAPGRFSGGNNPPPSSTDSIPRFSNAANRNQQSQPVDSSAWSAGNRNQQSQSVDSSVWNADQINKSAFRTNDPPTQSNFRAAAPQFGDNQRTSENRTTVISNSNRFGSNHSENQQPSFEQKRPFGAGFGQDDKQSGEGGFQRGGFNNRGGTRGFSERGGRGGFNGENNDPSGGYNRRGGGFSGRGGRGRGSYERNDSYRNQNDDRPRNTNSDRGGGFANRRDQGGNNDFGQRDRGGFSNFRGGSHTHGTDELRLSFDDNSNKAASGWSNSRSTSANFEAGDRFEENQIPKEGFKFVVSHVENANQFFIQLLSKGAEIAALSDTLQKEYKQSPEGNLSSFKLNQPCLAKSSDGCWYRAIVIATGVTKLKIRFVDFGDTTDVDSNMVRLIAKKQCAPAPYAYQCTFPKAQVVENVKNESVIEGCAGKEFDGKILSKTSDGKFLLESDQLLKFLVRINAIKVKSEVILKSIKCLIGHIEADQEKFFIQEDEEILNQIANLIETEAANAPTLSLDEVKQLKSQTIVLARYDDVLYRGIIQSDESDDDVNICFVDYGNISSCPKNSLKRASEQLISYPYQAKECRLHGVASKDMNEALAYLGDNTDPDNNLQISIVNEKDQVRNVLVYINNQCLNEKFGYDPNKEQVETTVEERKQPSSTSEPAPPTSEQTPSTSEPAPPTSEQTPSTSEPAPPTPEQTPSTSEPAPPTPEQTPSTSEQTPPTSEQTPSTSEQLPLTSEQQTTEVASDELAADKAAAEEPASKYREGVLTHIEKSKPYVYLQLHPESQTMLEQINTLIDKVVQEDQRNASYEIGDHIIAQFSEDNDYYRARIESYSSSSGLYTVYFLDYGNIDEDVPIDHLYSYNDDLKQIEPQAHGYLVDQVNSETWTDIIRPMVEGHLNEIIQFYCTDEDPTVIHLKFDSENVIDNLQETSEEVPPTVEEDATFSANISASDKDSFYIQILPDGNLHACEIEEMLQICARERKDSWAINDLCIVSDEHNRYFRGQILAIDEKKYQVKCIDYGNCLQNVTDDHLYGLPDEPIYKKSALATQCRLYGVDDEHQTQAIEEVIRKIPISERVTVTVKNDPNDSCWFVTLVRENHDNINQRYSAGKNETTDDQNKQESDNDEKKETTLPDSAIAINEDTNEQSTPQSEQANQSRDHNVTENHSTLSITNNQTIDFGENDPSTTIKDETNNSISSN